MDKRLAAHLFDKTEVIRIVGSFVHMECDRAARLSQMQCNLTRPFKGTMRKHDKPYAHAQFPLDMRPNASNCRHPVSFSDHSHQRPFRP